MNILKWHNAFSTDLKLNYNSKSTIDMYAHYVKKFLEHFKLEKEPKAIQTIKIKEYLLTFKTLNTRKQNVSAIKRFYELTVKMPNKVGKIPYPKKVKSLPKIIDHDFIIEKLEKISNLKHKAILLLTYSGALRVSEVLNLKLENIDRARMQLHIIDAKGNKDRNIKLSKKLLALLEKYYREFKPIGYLFNGQFENKYSSTSCNAIIKKYLGKEYSMHTLRHAAATTILENGTDIYHLQKMLGHNSPKTTQIYLHTTNKSIQNVNLAY